jgi:predicted nucleic acid-binding Zn ribbon protein
MEKNDKKQDKNDNLHFFWIFLRILAVTVVLDMEKAINVIE